MSLLVFSHSEKYVSLHTTLIFSFEINVYFLKSCMGFHTQSLQKLRENLVSATMKTGNLQFCCSHEQKCSNSSGSVACSTAARKQKGLVRSIIIYSGSFASHHSQFRISIFKTVLSLFCNRRS